MTMPIVVGTGLVALDVVFRGDSVEPIRRCTGGTCGNVLTILSYLGWRAIPVARLAEDRACAIIESDFARWRVDTQFIKIEPVAPTPIVVERLMKDSHGEPIHRFSWTCPCCGAWLPKYKPVSARATKALSEHVPAPSVFFFDRPSRGAIELALAFREQGALVMFEPSAGGEPALFEAALELADIIKYSDQRFAALPPHQSRFNRRLEIQTLGADGLRYRLGAGRRLGTWRQLKALPATKIVDTSGAGDWCTAGLLARLGMSRREGFESVTAEEIRSALRYGQALSSWNCRFEGARGGMYDQAKLEFEREVQSILMGDGDAITAIQVESKMDSLEEICPSCPPRSNVDIGRESARSHG